MKQNWILPRKKILCVSSPSPDLHMTPPGNDVLISWSRRFKSVQCQTNVMLGPSRVHQILIHFTLGPLRRHGNLPCFFDPPRYFSFGIFRCLAPLHPKKMTGTWRSTLTNHPKYQPIWGLYSIPKSQVGIICHKPQLRDGLWLYPHPSGTWPSSLAFAPPWQLLPGLSDSSAASDASGRSSSGSSGGLRMFGPKISAISQLSWVLSSFLS